MTDDYAAEGSRIPRITSADAEYVSQMTHDEALACLASALNGHRKAPHVLRYLRLTGDAELMAAWEVAQAAIGAVGRMVDEKRQAKGKGK